jgi:hypothetical protein
LPLHLLVHLHWLFLALSQAELDLLTTELLLDKLVMAVLGGLGALALLVAEYVIIQDYKRVSQEVQAVQLFPHL